MQNSHNVRLDCGHTVPHNEHRWVRPNGASECADCGARKQKKGDK